MPRRWLAAVAKQSARLSTSSTETWARSWFVKGADPSLTTFRPRIQLFSSLAAASEASPRPERACDDAGAPSTSSHYGHGRDGSVPGVQLLPWAISRASARRSTLPPWIDPLSPEASVLRAAFRRFRFQMESQHVRPADGIGADGRGSHLRGIGYIEARFEL